MRVTILIAVMLAACAAEQKVPTDTMLWRVNGWRQPPPGARQDVRVSLGTIVTFRSSGEYVEVHCALIEQPDQTVLIQSGRPCVAAVGRWEQKGGEVIVTREIATAAALCSKPAVVFRVTGNSVTADLTGEGPQSYTPVTRFVAPEFESQVELAKKSGKRCAPPLN
jgi:hypothetical protein